GLGLLHAAHEPPARAAAAGGRLDRHGRADGPHPALGRLVGEALGRAGDDRYPRPLHGLARCDLVAHGPDHVAARADERDALADAQVGEVAVLRQEPVAGVDGLGAGLLRDLHDALAHQVRLARRRRAAVPALVGEAHVQGVAVDVRVDGDRLDAHLAAGAHHAHRELPAIGDQDLLEHGGLRRLRVRGQSGMLPCFLGGFWSRFVASISSERMILARVSSGRITSSMYPSSAALKGLANFSRYSASSSTRRAAGSLASWSSLRNTMLTAPSGPITAISAVG